MTITPPQLPVHVITNPPGDGVNLFQPSDPMTVSDTRIWGGGNTAFQIQPKAPGRTLERCQAFVVAAGGAGVVYGMHAVYAKARATAVVDFTGTASRYAASGLSARYGAFVARRFQLDGFPILLTYYEEDTAPGTVEWTDGAGVFTNAGIWISQNGVTTCNKTFTATGLNLSGRGWFAALDHTIRFTGQFVANGCTLNGAKVTAANFQNFPAGQLVIK